MQTPGSGRGACRQARAPGRRRGARAHSRDGAPVRSRPPRPRQGSCSPNPGHGAGDQALGPRAPAVRGRVNCAAPPPPPPGNRMEIPRKTESTTTTGPSGASGRVPPTPRAGTRGDAHTLALTVAGLWGPPTGGGWASQTGPPTRGAGLSRKGGGAPTRRQRGRTLRASCTAPPASLEGQTPCDPADRAYPQWPRMQADGWRRGARRRA